MDCHNKPILLVPAMKEMMWCLNTWWLMTVVPQWTTRCCELSSGFVGVHIPNTQLKVFTRQWFIYTDTHSKCFCKFGCICLLFQASLLGIWNCTPEVEDKVDGETKILKFWIINCDSKIVGIIEWLTQLPDSLCWNRATTTLSVYGQVQNRKFPNLQMTSITLTTCSFFLPSSSLKFLYIICVATAQC